LAVGHGARAGGLEFRQPRLRLLRLPQWNVAGKVTLAGWHPAGVTRGAALADGKRCRCPTAGDSPARDSGNNTPVGATAADVLLALRQQAGCPDRGTCDHDEFFGFAFE